MVSFRQSMPTGLALDPVAVAVELVVGFKALM
jgi:hypothetical protein